MGKYFVAHQGKKVEETSKKVSVLPQEFPASSQVKAWPSGYFKLGFLSDGLLVIISTLLWWVGYSS